jgi:hypothetical protein
LLTDLREMTQATLGEPGAVNVVILTDWDASQTVAGSTDHFPEGVQLFRIPGGGAEFEVVAEAPEQNLDDPDVLATVVRDVFTAFPAQRRGIVLWDHGGSWSGGFGSDTQNGTVTVPSPMPAEEIPAAVRAGLEAAGVDAARPLDFIAFDTCLMAGAEVAYPFRDLASLYIANAEIDYGAGWDYTATFSYIAQNPEVSPAELARAEVAQWNAHHEQASANDALLRSHVALDLSRLDAFAEAAADFTSALDGSDGFETVELGRAGFFALPPYSSQFENAGSVMPGLRDAGQLFSALSQAESDPSVAAAAAEALEALEGLVLESSQGALRVAAEQAGVHVELSLASQLTPDKASEYAQRAPAWSEASGWQNLLETLGAAADAEPPSSEHAVLNGEGASLAAPPVLQFRSDAADIAKAAVYAGETDGESVLLYGLVGSGIVEPDEDYEFAWDASVALFSDGQPAMLDIWLDSGSADAEPVLTVPGLLAGAAEEPLMTNLVFTPAEGGASAAVVSLGDVASTLSLAEIAAAAPSATFSPLYYLIDASSGETSLIAGEPLPLPDDGVYAFSPGYLQAGSYLLLTSLTDVWGNTGVEVDSVVLTEALGE